MVVAGYQVHQWQNLGSRIQQVPCFPQQGQDQQLPYHRVCPFGSSIWLGQTTGSPADHIEDVVGGNPHLVQLAHTGWLFEGQVGVALVELVWWS